MKGLVTLRLAGLAAIGSTFAFQLQLPFSREQTTLVVDQQQHGNPKPLVDSDALQATIKGKNLLARAKDLYKIAQLAEPEYNHPTRVIGSEGHLGTLSYIYSTIAKFSDYYTLTNQSFPASTSHINEYRLVLSDEVPASAAPLHFTPATKNKEPIYGNLVLVENAGCSAADYPAAVQGNVAFVLRGGCSFSTKSELAGKAGAVASVIYNNGPNEFYGTLEPPSSFHVATFGLSGKEATPFTEKLKEGKTVDASAYVDAETSSFETTNIIAQTIQGDPDNCVMLGGHSDSVAQGPGINDDGSGALTLLEVASQLAKFDVNNCVRFAWWTAEEEGLLGSDYYVSVLLPEENRKIRLFMDYDMLGSPNYAYMVYDGRNNVNPVGSQELRDLYVDWYQDHGLNYTFTPFDGRSDYAGFIKHGIPGGGMATGAEEIKSKEEAKMFGGNAGEPYDPCYHQLCDDVGNVNLTAWELNTKVSSLRRFLSAAVLRVLICLQLVAHSVATFALSFQGFPERSDATSAGVYEQGLKYHGHRLVM